MNEKLNRAIISLLCAIGVFFIGLILAVMVNNKGVVGDISTRPAPQEKIICESLVPKGDISDNEISQIFMDINAERIKQGLPLLCYAGELENAATVRAVECSESFSHTRPDGSEWWTVDPNVCYGEVLAANYSYKIVVDAWMNSPTHRDCLLSNEYHYLGVGYYKTYIVVEFG